MDDTTYLVHNPDWHQGDAVWKARHVVEILARHAIRPRSICDVGCGTGGVLREIALLFGDNCRMVGYEPSSAPVPMRSSESPVELRNSDVRQSDDHFDVMLLLDVFEHVEDYLGFLYALRTRADWFIFHIPLELSAQAVAREVPLIHARRTVGHLHHFTKQTALATLEDTGFVVVDHQFTFSSRQVAKRRLRTVLAALPRRVALSINKDLAVRVLGGASLLVLARQHSTDSDSSREGG